MIWSIGVMWGLGCAEAPQALPPTPPAPEVVAPAAPDTPQQKEAFQGKDVVVVVRLGRAGEKAPTTASFATAKQSLASHDGYLGSSLHLPESDGGEYTSMSLTAWRDAEALGAAAVDLVSPEAGPTGQYRALMSMGRAVRPSTGTYSVVVPFDVPPSQYDDVLAQTTAFAKVAEDYSESWDGMVVLAPAGGAPDVPLLAITSWTDQEDARAFHVSKPAVELYRRMAGGVSPSAGLTFMQVVAH